MSNQLIKQIAKERNIYTFDDYYNRLKVLALSRFKWINLPPTCNERALERYLFDYGYCAFVFDEDRGYLNPRVTLSGALNLYDEPLSYQCYGIGYNKEFKLGECVIINNNIMRQPTHQTIQMFAYRLADIERTTDVNLAQQKLPRIVVCSDKERLTLEKVISNIDDNCTVIFGQKDWNLENFKSVDTSAPYLLDKLDIHKQKVMNEALTYLGINNANMDKKERLVTDEVNANNDYIDLMCDTFYEMRLKACEEINKMYGLKVTVERVGCNEILKKGDEEDGELHTRAKTDSE